MMAVPFLAVYFLVQEASYVGLLEFTAREIYQEVKPHGLLFGLLILILLLSCAAVMALPYNLLEKEKSFRKLCRGGGLLKKRWKEILLGFLLLHLIMAVVGGVFYVLSTLGMTGAAMLFKAGSREDLQRAHRPGIYPDGYGSFYRRGSDDRHPGICRYGLFQTSREKQGRSASLEAGAELQLVIQTGKEKSSYNSFTFADRSGRRVSGGYGSQP